MDIGFENGICATVSLKPCGTVSEVAEAVGPVAAAGSWLVVTDAGIAFASIALEVAEVISVRFGEYGDLEGPLDSSDGSTNVASVRRVVEACLDEVADGLGASKLLMAAMGRGISACGVKAGGVSSRVATVGVDETRLFPWVIFECGKGADDLADCAVRLAGPASPAEESALAIPEPPTNAAPTPTVTAPTPSQE